MGLDKLESYLVSPDASATATRTKLADSLCAAAIVHELGLNPSFQASFLDNVIIPLGDLRRNQQCAKWDPMMAGVLHGTGHLAKWGRFKQVGLTFAEMTTLSHPDFCLRCAKNRAILTLDDIYMFNQVRVKALEIRALLEQPDA